MLDLFDEDKDFDLYTGSRNSLTGSLQHSDRQSAYSLARESAAKTAERNLYVRRPQSQSVGKISV
jgi:hypothetical protein